MGRAGRPTVAIELTDEERETLGALVATAFVVAGVGVAVADRAGLRGRQAEHQDRRRARL